MNTMHMSKLGNGPCIPWASQKEKPFVRFVYNTGNWICYRAPLNSSAGIGVGDSMENAYINWRDNWLDRAGA